MSRSCMQPISFLLQILKRTLDLCECSHLKSCKHWMTLMNSILYCRQWGSHHFPKLEILVEDNLPCGPSYLLSHPPTHRSQDLYEQSKSWKGTWGSTSYCYQKKDWTWDVLELRFCCMDSTQVKEPKESNPGEPLSFQLTFLPMNIWLTRRQEHFSGMLKC